ncbi:hypothetical protein IE4803_PB00234 (plasmid) [Rhizobium etli bv. phaseoli str. IE4803]|nr:hypothetical protein IE4803_PB00234 [Rhizobium etli bv. phaseoli str. IE4803]ARQ60678.1 hypothetical protein Kim5_PA00207 [Rhizobium sp. Kim5]
MMSKCPEPFEFAVELFKSAEFLFGWGNGMSFCTVMLLTILTQNSRLYWASLCNGNRKRKHVNVCFVAQFGTGPAYFGTSKHLKF